MALYRPTTEAISSMMCDLLAKILSGVTFNLIIYLPRHYGAHLSGQVSRRSTRFRRGHVPAPPKRSNDVKMVTKGERDDPSSRELSSVRGAEHVITWWAR
ncbi:Multidrug resistance protein [Stygiomarasmius scandens]|uniref:Multidrug resistance protein n=1 Tax=Marasmiellus scandens TaxID=2682957 RepID=A0ABR1IRN2_9AGAR